MPKKNGTIVLVWLINIVSLSFFLTSVMLSSMPMANMKSISPNWLSMLMLPKDSAGKRNADTLGIRLPKTDGPSMIPATISPMTVGWPIFTKSHPNRRHVNNIVIICSSKMPIDDSILWVTSFTKSEKPSPRSRGESLADTIASFNCWLSPSLMTRYISEPKMRTIVR